MIVELFLVILDGRSMFGGLFLVICEDKVW